MKRDWMIAVGLFLAALALRIPFQSRWAYQWDSAQFALAVEHFDLQMGQPHVPGQYLYVMAGRLVNSIAHNPHASLVWLSVVAGAVLPALGFFLGAALYGRAAGIATGLILATSPLCWFQSEIALTTMVDAALVTAMILAGWRAMQRGGRWGDVVLLAALLTWIAGNRAQTAVGILPAWLFVFAHFKKWPVKLGVGLSLAGLLGLVWLVPTVRLAGGWPEYWHLLRLKMAFDAPRSGWNGGALSSLAVIAKSCGLGLLAAAVWAAVGWKHRAQGDGRLLVWWIVPLLAMGVILYTAMPGHVLSYFPALAILCGRICRQRIMLIVIAGINVGVFFFLARSDQNHERQMADAVAVVRRYRPEEVALCHREQFFHWSFRQFQYHLPEYTNLLLGRDRSLADGYWVGRGARTEFVDDWQDVARGRKLLLIAPPGDAVELFSDRLDVTQARPVAAGIFECEALP